MQFVRVLDYRTPPPPPRGPDVMTLCGVVLLIFLVLGAAVGTLFALCALVVSALAP